jgi:hypothetical protein
MTEKTCKIKDCNEKFLAKELCKYHYNRKRHGSIRFRRRKNNPIIGCTIKGCEKKFFAKDLCRYHYDVDWQKKHRLERIQYFIKRRINRY